MDETHSEIINDQGSDCSLEGKTKRQHVKIPKRKIIIEPVLMIAMVFAFPFMQVSQLFIYSKLEDYTAHKTGYNLSHVKGNNSLTNCDINKSSSEYVFVQEVQKYNSYFNIILSLCSAFPSFFVMLFIGGYSDKHGRKYIILLPLIGGFFQTSIYLLVIALNLPVWSLWIADFIYGCCGGFKLLFVGCFTYLADITTKEQRLFRITMAELSTFLAGILGPIGIGYWIQQQGYAWPMLFSVSGHILNIIYTIFFVPETIVKDPAVDVKFFSLSHFKHTANVFTRKTADNRRWKLWVLFITFSIQSIAFGTYEVKQLFMLNIPLCWGAVMIGYYSTVSIAVSSIFGMVAAKVLKYCMSDSIVALISAGFCTVQYLYTGFVKNTIMMFISTAFSPLGTLLTPTNRALISKLVDDDEQGSVFSTIGVAEVITMLIGSEGFKLMYANTLYVSSTFVFFVAAMVYFVETVILIIYNIMLHQESKKTYRRLENIEHKKVNADS